MLVEDKCETEDEWEECLMGFLCWFVGLFGSIAGKGKGGEMRGKVTRDVLERFV